ncbi:hypothetical protein IWW48_002704 [Coemansia sp. RSA 1200]|nr:hypothetical protein IWW48_002704 [Coemansia sp. RSA 1200]
MSADYLSEKQLQSAGDAIPERQHLVRRRQYYAAVLSFLAMTAYCVYVISGRHLLTTVPVSNRKQHLALSTKTPYAVNQELVADTPPGGFELLQVQQLTRHGARYPTHGEMEDIKHVYEMLRPIIPASWILYDLIDSRNAGLLSRSGEREIAGIAERAKTRYHDIFDKAALIPESVRFVSSDRQRTRVSAQTFRDVLSEDIPNLQQVVAVPQENDTTLAMHHICPAWIRDSARLREYEIALETLKFDSLNGQTILWAINLRLGSAKAVRLMYDVDTIYRLCGYDLSLYNNAYRWCSLLDPVMAEYLELRRDIEYSRVYGPYGSDVNKKMACAMFTEILADIDRALDSPAAAVSTFRFAHAETMMFVSSLLKLETRLGKNSSPIVGNMTLADAKDRGFKTTFLAPFSTNLAIELYRVGRKTGFFRLLLNEQVISLADCVSDICPIRVLREKLAAHVGCNFTAVCQVDE